MKKALIVTLLVLTLLQLVPLVGAHGGGVARITNQPIGDYVVSVWLNPDQPRTGDIHVTVGLALNQEPVLNHDISVQLIDVAGNKPTRTAPALHENAVSRFLYEADIVVPSAGDYLVVVGVDGTDETVSFEMPVAAESWLNSPFTITVALTTVVITLGYGIISGRKRNG